MSHYLRWFATAEGRRFANLTVAGVAGVIFASKFLPHTIFLDKYIDIFYQYKSGFQTELSESLRQNFVKCLDTLEMPPIYRKHLRAFPVYGFDLFHAGTFDSKNGVAVGIPQNFTYNTIDDIDKNKIQIDFSEISWSSNAGVKLADSFVFTENEKIFGICREILMTNSYKVLLDSIFPPTIVVASYFLGNHLKRRFMLMKGPLFLRFVLYSLTTVFGGGLYFFTKDVTQVQYETGTDMKLCTLGPEFIEAGVGFYDKLLNRNIALRELLGAKGESTYTAYGNKNTFLRYKHLPLTVRKSFFETKLKELRENPNSEGDASL